MFKIHNLKNEDWNFSSCPEDQLSDCFDYECSRHSAIVRRDVETWRARFPGTTFEEYQAHVAAGNDPMFAWAMFPEFPENPFLAIENEERKRRLTAASGVHPVMYSAEEGTGEWLIETIYDLQQEFDHLSKLEGVAHHGYSYEIDGALIKCPAITRTFAVFRFAWDAHSDESFVSAFKSWLKANRTQDVLPMFEKRGAGSESRTIRSQLNQLAAIRLLECMTWQEAADLTQKQLGKPLYSEQSAWTRARNCAKGFIPENPPPPPKPISTPKTATPRKVR